MDLTYSIGFRKAEDGFPIANLLICDGDGKVLELYPPLSIKITDKAQIDALDSVAEERIREIMSIEDGFRREEELKRDLWSEVKRQEKRSIGRFKKVK